MCVWVCVCVCGGGWVCVWGCGVCVCVSNNLRLTRKAILIKGKNKIELDQNN